MPTSVFNKGIDEFYAECEKVGVDSVLVADACGRVRALPPPRCVIMSHLSLFASPNADDDLLRQIASYGRGYTYLLSRRSDRAENRAALPSIIWLRS